MENKIYLAPNTDSKLRLNFSAPLFGGSPTGDNEWQDIGTTAPIVSRVEINHPAWGMTVKSRKALLATMGFPLHSRFAIHARAENIHKTPTFKDSWFSRRCIVPAVAFHSVVKTQKTITCYKHYREDGLPFGLAGIWTIKSLGGYDMYQSNFCLVTMAAHGHNTVLGPRERQEDNRILAVLPKGLYDSWLDCEHNYAMDILNHSESNRLCSKEVFSRSLNPMNVRQRRVVHLRQTL